MNRRFVHQSGPSAVGSHRAGYALAHVLVLTTVSALLIALSTSTLLSLIRLQRGLRSQTFHNVTIWRLSRQLRDDAHAAYRVDFASSDAEPSVPNRMMLQLAENRQVLYEWKTDQIVRTLRSPPAILHRDSYPMPVRETVRWQAEPRKNHTIVRLWLPRTVDGPRSEPAESKTVCITAVVGLDHRFSRVLNTRSIP